MKKLRLLVLEDEPIIADDLAMCLEEMGHEIIAMPMSYDEVMDALEQNLPDLALLDIRVKGEKDGIDVAKVLRSKYDVPFLFITSFYDRQTVMRVSALSPLGFVVKPFKEADLTVAMQLAIGKMSGQKTDKATESQKLLVRQNNGTMVPLNPEEIAVVSADNNYCEIITDDQKFVVNQTLKSIEERLINHGFCRVHKTHLINLDKIDLVEGSVVFVQGKMIPIGKAYRQTFLQSLTIL